MKTKKTQLADDILIHRRRFFIMDVKEPLRKYLVKFTSGTLSWIGAPLTLIKIVVLIRRYPEPTHENARHPNTHILIDLWDLFFRYEDNPGRRLLFCAIRKLVLCTYEHDPYYARRIDWFVEKLVEKYLSKEWRPRKAYSPTGHWTEPAVLEAIKELKMRLLKSAGLPPDTPMGVFDRCRSNVKGGTQMAGVKKVVCTCGKKMENTGGVFGGEITNDTYYCSDCRKHVIVVTPNQEEQEKFAQRVS